MADPVLGYDDEELVVVVVNDRNWKGIGISLVVIATIFSFIGLAIFILTPNEVDEDFGKYRINLTDLLSKSLQPFYFTGSWISESQVVFEDELKNICLLDVKTNESKTVLARSSIINQYNVQDFKLSPDGTYILFEIAFKNNFNSTSINKYKIFNTSTSNIAPFEHFIRDSVTKDSIIQYVTWSTKGNALAFVANNDLFYVTSIGETPIRVTNNGVSGTIFNAIPDWLYKVVIRMKIGLWWSKHGKSLIYAVFDDTLVEENVIKIYQTFEETQVDLNSSPNIIKQRYPKAGESIPKVALWVARLDQMVVIKEKIFEPEEIKSKEIYLTHVNWLNEEEAIVMWIDRYQNNTIIATCSALSKWRCKTVVNIVEKIKVEEFQDLITIEGTSNSFMRIPNPEYISSNYYSIAYFNHNEKFINYVTHRQYNIIKLVAYDSKNGLLYFQGNLPDQSYQANIYSIAIIDKTKNIKCITCHLDDECKYFEAFFNPSVNYYILQCLGPYTVYTQLRHIKNNTLVSTLISNESFKLILKEKRLPQQIFRSFKIDSGLRKINLKILLPPVRKKFEMLNEDEEDEEVIKYPLVVEAISLENTQFKEIFKIDWGQYLSSAKEYIYVQVNIDIERKQNHEINSYYSLKSQLEDQLAVIEYLDSNFNNINKNRVAIWGWSSSAFSSLSTLIIDQNKHFKCTIAVSPITNWKLMDTITAEQVFGNPVSRKYNTNYDLSNLILKAQELKDRKFLIIHGTADDKVHIQHTMLLIKSLINQMVKGTINYQIYLYPDEDHYLSNSRLHFYKMMETFLDRCFTSINPWMDNS